MELKVGGPVGCGRGKGLTRGPADVAEKRTYHEFTSAPVTYTCHGRTGHFRHYYRGPPELRVAPSRTTSAMKILAFAHRKPVTKKQKMRKLLKSDCFD